MCSSQHTGEGTSLPVAQVRCLLSRADPAIKRQKQRETQYSLEAISLNGSSSWIGINQSAVTRYLFLDPEVPCFAAYCLLYEAFSAA